MPSEDKIRLTILCILATFIIDKLIRHVNWVDRYLRSFYYSQLPIPSTCTDTIYMYLYHLHVPIPSTCTYTIYIYHTIYMYLYHLHIPIPSTYTYTILLQIFTLCSFLSPLIGWIFWPSQSKILTRQFEALLLYAIFR